jgi:hypothetical protein
VKEAGRVTQSNVEHGRKTRLFLLYQTVRKHLSLFTHRGTLNSWRPSGIQPPPFHLRRYAPPKCFQTCALSRKIAISQALYVALDICKAHSYSKNVVVPQALQPGYQFARQYSTGNLVLEAPCLAVVMDHRGQCSSSAAVTLLTEPEARHLRSLMIATYARRCSKKKAHVYDPMCHIEGWVQGKASSST